MEESHVNHDKDMSVSQQIGGKTDVEIDLRSHIKEARHVNSDINQQQVNDKPMRRIDTTSSKIFERHSGNNNGAQAVDERKKSKDFPARAGSIRHIIALLALSSILLANMNRQAFNQALVRMIQRSPVVASTREPTSTAINNLAYAMTTGVPALITQENYHDGATSLRDSDKSGLELSLPNKGSAHDYNNNDNDEVLVRTEEEIEEEEGFDWSGAQISALQSAFSYGYMLFMIPGGRLSEIYGAKWIIFMSSFGSALCSLMTPFLAHYNFTLLVISRVLMGLCQTGVSPALYAMFSRWLPPDESSVYLPMIKVGVMLGFMSGSLINGFLSWPSVFYAIGLLGFIWSAFWVFFASSLPDEHRFIDEEERVYIQKCLERHSNASKKIEDVEANGAKAERKKSSKSAPWFRILKNPIVLAFTFTKFTVKLSTDTQTMQIPMYLRKVFMISDKLNGLMNASNFAIQAIFTGIVAYTAKEMVVRGQFGLQKTGIRRLFQGINCFGMSLAYLLISFNMGSLELVCGAVILLSITSMFGAGGEAVLPIDLTTEYSASIMAIANSAANLSGIMLPPIVSLLLANQLTDPTRWTYVWWFISFVMTCGGLMFICFVKAKIQGFNDGLKRKVKVCAQEHNWGTQDKRTINGVLVKMTKGSEAVNIEIGCKDRTSQL